VLAPTTTASSGFWSANANRSLGNGSYVISATATDSLGRSLSSTLLPASQPLKVDTTAPTISSVAYNRAIGQVTVTFQDNLSGLNVGSILNRAEYSFKSSGKRAANLVTSVTATPTSSGATTETVTLSIKGGKKLKTGVFSLSILAGAQDVAGNALNHTSLYSVKPGKQLVTAAGIKSAALTVHDAALSTVHVAKARRHHGK
jgi:hypothetical protein